MSWLSRIRKWERGGAAVAELTREDTYNLMASQKGTEIETIRGKPGRWKRCFHGFKKLEVSRKKQTIAKFVTVLLTPLPGYPVNSPHPLRWWSSRLKSSRNKGASHPARLQTKETWNPNKRKWGLWDNMFIKIIFQIFATKTNAGVEKDIRKSSSLRVLDSKIDDAANGDYEVSSLYVRPLFINFWKCSASGTPLCTVAPETKASVNLPLLN